MAVVISDKTDLKSIMKNDKEHFLIIKGSFHYKGIAIINVHVPSNRALKSTSKKTNRMKGRNKWGYNQTERI